VQIGTANFVDPFVWNKVLDGLDDYMARHQIERLSDLIGAFDPTPPKVVHR
jgi:dihydroorotate dehydrogenase (NAD+) catalytic subunit